MAVKRKRATSNIKSNKEKIDTTQKKEIAFDIQKLPGVYTNAALVHHTVNEFVFDFLLDVAGQVNFVSRVITSPDHMKRLSVVINDQLKKYEERFGEIKIKE